MSHFLVLVPAKDEKELDQKLLPYYEHGCSRHYDELIKPYLEFKVEYHKDKFEVGAQEILNSIHNQDLKNEFATLFKEGLYTQIFESYDGGELGPDGHWGYWHNPNAKWDWYVVGGRWSGVLDTYDPKSEPLNWKICSICHGTGDRPGWVTYKIDPQKPGEKLRVFVDDWAKKCDGCNACQGRGVVLKHSGFFVSHGGDALLMGEIDWKALAQEQLELKMALYHDYHTAWKKAESKFSWDDFSEEEITKETEMYSKKSKRDENFRNTYTDLKSWLLSRKVDSILAEEYDIFKLWSFDEIQDFHTLSADEYQKKFKVQALSFAFIDLEGQWHERAERGFWAMTGDDIPDYNEKFWKFIESLQPNQRIYAVDCHI